jgi:AcrR family transcriptional regulator
VARPVNADPQLTKERILLAAIECFGNEGLRGTPLKSIAAEAKVTIATIHHYFGGKLGLFEAALEQGYEELTGLGPAIGFAAVETDGTLEERIDAIARRALSFARGRLKASRFLLRAMLYESEAKERAMRAQEQYVATTSEALSLLIGRSAEELRVPVQGLMFLMTRIAVMRPEDLAIVGPERSQGATLDALADYVAEVAVKTLLPETPSTQAPK